MCACETARVDPTGRESHAQLHHAIMDDMRSCLPSDIYPRPDDTSKSLSRRLGACAYLDDIHVLAGGHGPGRVRLNDTAMAQPRRVTWGAEVPLEERPERPELANELFCSYAYTQFARLPEDWRCRPMPPPVDRFRMYVWHLAKSTKLLSPYCMLTPPTGIQLMLYYAAFGGSVGRHRDNYNINHLSTFLDVRSNLEHDVDFFSELTAGHTPSSDTNSQRVGSDVLIWSDGNVDMELCLSFPPKRDRTASNKEYVVRPELTVPMLGGHLFVFKAMDDLTSRSCVPSPLRAKLR